MGEKRGGGLMGLLRRVKIQTRLLITFLLLSLVPVLFIGIFAYNTYTGSINAKLGDSAEQNVELLDTILNTELERYAFYLNALSVLDTVQNVLAESSGETDDMPAGPAGEGFASGTGETAAIGKRNMITDITDLLTDFIVQSDYLRNIRIADRNGSVVYDYPYSDVDEDQYQEMLRRAEAASPKDSVYYVKTFRSVNILVLGRKIYRYASAREHIGYIFVYVNEKMLGDTIYPDVSYGEGSETFLVDGDGLVLSDRDGAMLGGSVRDEDLFARMQQARAEGHASFNTTWRGGQVLAAFSYSQRYGSYFVTTIPQSYIAGETMGITRSLVAVAIVLIALSFAATFIVYFSIMQPIRTIVSRCNVVADEDLDREIGDTSPDELGFLARTIDRIIAELKGMAYTWQQDQLRKRELELEMLQYQINPHFLFNTLNTLRWVAVMNEVPVLEAGISSLSSLLQSTLIRTEEFITIGDEIMNLRHYFAIQRIRYADSFDVEYKLDEALLAYRIPRFIAQPIAENAIIHGSADGERKINITVGLARGEGGDIVIEIADDGVGFEADVPAAPAKEKFSGIGLKNVDERLRLYFGAAHGLEMSSVVNVGTVCRILVPKSWLDREGKSDA